MIAVKPPPQTGVEPASHPTIPGPGQWRRTRSKAWSSRLSATLLAAAILVSLGGGGLFDLGTSYSMQGRAEALHARWAWMVDNGIPQSDMAPLQREWTLSQASRWAGAGSVFWLPGGEDAINRWQAES